MIPYDVHTLLINTPPDVEFVTEYELVRPRTSCEPKTYVGVYRFRGRYYTVTFNGFGRYDVVEGSASSPHESTHGWQHRPRGEHRQI